MEQDKRSATIFRQSVYLPEIVRNSMLDFHVPKEIFSVFFLFLLNMGAKNQLIYLTSKGSREIRQFFIIKSYLLSET
jgi:hypothetical protein